MKPIPGSFVVGQVRVQPLGPYLVRIEQKGAKGFEDRETFTIDTRRFPPVHALNSRVRGAVRIATKNYRVVVPAGAAGLAGIRVESGRGQTLCVLSSALLAKQFLPTPSALPAVWTLGDAPRVVPAPRGALPPPAGEEEATSGWDLQNDAPDVYVFFPRASGYARFRADFLRLTGRIPLVPLYALGLWYSRYHPYNEQTALGVVRRFRKKKIPLDVFVADTDWRVGASCGYAINETLFPDMGRFVRRAHRQQVRVMLNDHPEPKGSAALDPGELRFRHQGLTSLLARGVDLWWFDRNWHTHLHDLAPGLNKEVWGMRLYHDVTRDFRPGQRPLIMSNVDGINNGRLDAPSHPAAHRFPVWWTGDTVAEWGYLRMGVENGVASGVRSLLPYVHEDLGGHHGQPGPELYVRFMQFGAFAPVARIHCTANVHRYPWKYGAAVERIVGDFFRLRYRLLPMLYAAARAAHRSGTPLLRRCDLAWPAFPEAADATQYLLGDDLLVAPIVAPARAHEPARRSVWIPPGEWADPWTGQIHRGPALVGVACPLERYPLFVRQGGLVLSTAQRQATGIAVWPELVVDAFVPARNQTSTRWLYEDDGISMAYEKGEYALTRFAMTRRGKTTEIAMEPETPSSGILPERRRLTLRIHLPVGAKVRAFFRDGAKRAAGDWTLIPPAKAPLATLFAGSGTPPPEQSGPVLEWRGELRPAEPAAWRWVCQAP